MGMYLNPGNSGFKRILKDYYVDKTGMIELINNRIDSMANLICISRPRRFGKSYAARMLCAYYDCTCKSNNLFKNFEISVSDDYNEHLNQYNVIYLDLAGIISKMKTNGIPLSNVASRIKALLNQEIRLSYPTLPQYDDASDAILAIVNETKQKFVFIIDEWDCVIRNSDDQKLIYKYLQFLHSMFKSEESKAFLALAYITGILPIKKIKDESALNNFHEYTMLDSYPITEFYGFTEDEVKVLCQQYNMDFDATKAWYNGYLIDGKHMYNPNSVTMAIERSRFDSYWRNTSSFSSINTFITMNYEGLKDDIMTMLSGGKVSVNTITFQNDFSTVGSKDEALTALIHLGYLGYDMDRKCAFIPNYEVASSFDAALQTGEWKDIAKVISKCDELLWATIDGNADKVAEIIELAHDTYTSVLKYNDENSLSCVLTMAYFTAPAYYNIMREMPAGKGFADFVFIPRANACNRPAMVVELKYNKDADTAIKQIKENRYQGALKGYSDKVLLVGINYDAKGKDKKNHSCVIEERKNI